MPRLHFKQMNARGPDALELVLPRPTAAPEGYTPVTFVTEWLTLNCCEDWACAAKTQALHLRFAGRADLERAAARFLTPQVVVSLTGAPEPGKRPKVRRRAAA
ncbi:MAG TPA: hypothetical protein VF495_26790 [Phenylobacterium sp.]